MTLIAKSDPLGAGLAVDADPIAPITSPADLSFSIVPHTHWDREWYLPFQQFRMRLARTVDEILDVLEADPDFRHFTLDGQAVILEDYVELRPQHEARLRALIGEGRIEVGPSYVLPDEYLAGGEALVRNLLVGAQVCRRFGGNPMAVGYMPDTFGHVAQLPQILRGFGLDTFVFWRGLGDEGPDLGAIFSWRAPDGSHVTAIRQLGSYGNANELGRWAAGGVSMHAQPDRWADVAAARFDRFVTQHGQTVARSEIHEVLLCNGADHMAIQRDLPALLAHSRSVHAGLRAEISTYEKYVGRVRPLARGQLRNHDGELCLGRDAPVLRGINSTRMYLKQANERTQRDLLVAETLATLASMRGAEYPVDELRFAWRELLRNLPHDSISGCSVDEVHRDMAARFAVTTGIAGRVRREALAALAGTTEEWTYRRPAAATVSIVNPLPWSRSGAIAIDLPQGLGRAPIEAETPDGRVLAAQPVTIDGQRKAWLPVSLAGFAAQTVTLRRRSIKNAPPPAGPGVQATLAGGGARLENEFVAIEVAPSGEMEVRDRSSGAVHAGLHVFEDVADRGDEYNFCPVAGERPWTSAGLRGRVRLLSTGPIVAEVEVTFVARLPGSLTRRRDRRIARTVSCPIRTVIRIVAGQRRIEFTTTVENRALDHRLRVRFASPSSGESVPAESHFAVIERPARTSWSGGAEWAEPPALTHHTSGFVSAGSVTVIGKGLPEYEAIPRADGGLDLALTLLRCVGWLSRDDLETRPNHAGPGIATPEAQCQGSHTFEYAVEVGGPSDDVALVRQSADYRVGFETGPGGVDLEGMLELSGDPVGFAALKRAEDGDGAILRLFNPGSAAARIAIAGRFEEALAIRLDEAPLGIPLTGDLMLTPGHISTVRLRGNGSGWGSGQAIPVHRLGLGHLSPIARQRLRPRDPSRPE